MPESPRLPDYRARLYARYGSAMQSAPEHFDEAAAARWGRAYGWYLRGWLPASKDARIVDLACGYGRLLHFFRTRGYRHIAGVDISPDQVRRARQVAPEVHEANVLDFLSAHAGEYDLITALDLIEHLRKDEALRFLDLCFAALKPGGRLVLQTPNADSPFGMASRYNDFTHEVCFNVNALTRLLALHGFTAIEARELGPVPWGYSVASSARWLVWQAIRGGLKFWNLAETGSAGEGVFSRNFLITGTRAHTVARTIPTADDDQRTLCGADVARRDLPGTRARAAGKWLARRVFRYHALGVLPCTLRRLRAAWRTVNPAAGILR